MQSLSRRAIRKPVPTMQETDLGSWAVRLLPAHEHHEHVAVLSVQGEIDLVTAPMLRDALISVVEHHAGPVVVDLSDVPFMDSTGVHVLMGTLGRLEPQNRALALVCDEESQVHRILVLAGLLDSVTVYRSRESAVIGGADVLGFEPSRNTAVRPTRGTLPPVRARTSTL